MDKIISNEKLPYTLVIGGAGFIGSHLSNRLALGGGRNVLAIGRSPTPRNPLLPSVAYLNGDVCDLSFISPLLRNSKEVIDLAYATIPKTSFDDPIADVLKNLPPSVNLIREASRHKVGRLLLVSSGGTVYGHPKYLPIDESHPTNPVSPYGITKLSLEKYALMFNKLEGLQTVIVRPSNPYGPLQFGRTGQGFIGNALISAMNGKPITVFGCRGTIRDYIYIDDLVSGIVCALEYGESGKIYNIGSGIGLDNMAVIDVIKSVVSMKMGDMKIAVAPERNFDVSANVLSSALLTYTSNWKPVVSLRDGLKKTYAWALNQDAQN